MKHAILLVILALTVYFGWTYMPESTKAAIKQFLGRHLRAIVLIFTAALALLVVSYYTPSIQIL